MQTTAASRARAALPLTAAACIALTLTACGGEGTDTAAASSDAETIVSTAFGDVAVPAEPARVITLAESALDVALAVGVEPVGTSAARGGDAAPAYLGQDAAGIPIVATVSEPNLEAIVEAAPDLILAAAGLEEAQYESLAEIAPTVVPERAAAGEWQAPLETYAAALGAEDELSERLDAVEERVAVLAESGAVDGSAGVIRWMASGPVLMNAGNMPGTLLQAAGATSMQAAVDLGAKPHSDPLSMENLVEIDADRLFIATFGEDGAAALAAAEAQPAFARLGAVEADAVSVVQGSVWSSASGPIAAELVVDDIAAAVGEG